MTGDGTVGGLVFGEGIETYFTNSHLKRTVFIIQISDELQVNERTRTIPSEQD